MLIDALSDVDDNVVGAALDKIYFFCGFNRSAKRACLKTREFESRFFGIGSDWTRASWSGLSSSLKRTPTLLPIGMCSRRPQAHVDGVRRCQRLMAALEQGERLQWAADSTGRCNTLITA